MEREYEISEIKEVVNLYLKSKVTFKATELQRLSSSEERIMFVFRTDSREIGHNMVSYMEDYENGDAFIWWYDNRTHMKREFRIKDCKVVFAAY